MSHLGALDKVLEKLILENFHCRGWTSRKRSIFDDENDDDNRRCWTSCTKTIPRHLWPKMFEGSLLVGVHKTIQKQHTHSSSSTIWIMCGIARVGHDAATVVRSTSARVTVLINLLFFFFLRIHMFFLLAEVRRGKLEFSLLVDVTKSSGSSTLVELSVVAYLVWSRNSFFGKGVAQQYESCVVSR